VIAEHPDVLLEVDSPAAQTAIRPRVNGVVHTARAFVVEVNCPSPDLPEQVPDAWPGSAEEADYRDMLRLVAGHEEALLRLMGRHAETLYSQLARVLRNRSEALDCLEETFVRIYRHRDRFDFHHKFSTWLYAIAFNLARDQLRRRARRPEFASIDDPEVWEDLAETLLDPEPPPDKRLDKKERARSLLEAVDALPEALRQPLISFAFDEKSQPEIAAELHCTTKAVEMRLYHARKQLRTLLEKEFKNGEGFCPSGRSNSQWSTKTKH
jgi:RNA polymerase sigma-70 factor (ECF subfamily)